MSNTIGSDGSLARTCAVIGAGIAGVTAAARLRSSGVAVVVFDKARGVGGRTSTRRAAPYAFDHGAQYFTARDPRFVAAVEGWVRDGVAAEWEARIVVLRDGATGSRAGEARFVGVPGMSAICKHAAQAVEVRVGTRVAEVLAESGRHRLVDVDGRSVGTFDTVLVTTPPAQARPLLASAQRLADRAASVVMLPCWTVMAAFAEPLDLPFEGAFVEDSPLGWVAHDGAKPGRPTPNAWVLQATPGWSAEHVGASPDLVTDLLLDAFARAASIRLPAATHRDAHRWMYARTEEAVSSSFLLADNCRLAVAGDWLLGARVEAAYLSGLAAAEALVGAASNNA